MGGGGWGECGKRSTTVQRTDFDLRRGVFEALLVFPCVLTWGMDAVYSCPLATSSLVPKRAASTRLVVVPCSLPG